MGLNYSIKRKTLWYTGDIMDLKTLSTSEDFWSIVAEQYRLGQVSVIQQLPSFSNQVWLVSLQDARRLVVKRYLSLSKDALLSIHLLINQLRNQGVDVPIIIPNGTGSFVSDYGGYPLEVSQYVDGRRFEYHGGDMETEELRKATEVLARIHSANIRTEYVQALDFGSVINEVLGLINAFKQRSGQIFGSIQNDAVRQKALILLEFINQTEQVRSVFLNSYSEKIFHRLRRCLVHGDYNARNILLEKSTGRLFVIDWEGVRAAPRSFELQRSVGFLCGHPGENGYLGPYDSGKLKTLIQTYHQNSLLSNEDLDAMVQFSEYFYLFHWLRFTLQKVLVGDFRILDVLSGNLNQMLFWQTNKAIYDEELHSIIEP